MLAALALAVRADEGENRAHAFLVQAEARWEADDHAGALHAYMEAVKADRAVADLETIRRYAPPGPGTVIGSPGHLAALRQFLELHPGHAEAEQDLAAALPGAGAVAFVSELLENRPRDPRLYTLRSGARLRAGQWIEALADIDQATALDPNNAELFYIAGASAHDIVTKRADLSVQQKREVAGRGIAAFERAESLRADYTEALMYHNLLLREQAQLESDPAVQRKLIEQADALRARAIAIIKARRPS